MKTNSMNSPNVFGKPAVSFVGMQVYYDCYKDKGDPIFTRDSEWFNNCSTPERLIRPAMGAEFNHADAHLDYFGKRVVPAKLWVSVERRLGGSQHVVQPVYRGPCYWKVDKDDYIIPDTGDNDVDKLLYRMHLSEGVYMPAMLALVEKVVEVTLASAQQDDAVQ